MSAKKRSFYECSDCGHQEPKWLGRCPSCGQWNTFSQAVEQKGTAKSAGIRRESSRPIPLDAVEAKEGSRFGSGIEELDRVLGGGVMRGSSVLIGGEPGIGKSTLMIQAASLIRGAGKVLYVSGEESPGQIRMRADRLGLESPDLEVLCESELDPVVAAMDSLKPGVIVIDSIQTLWSPEAGAVPGTVNQIKYCGYEIISRAKERNAVVFLVAHVTKEGFIAGPKSIEHMVDTVLYFEESGSDVRFLRASKNRFGSTDEIGLFSMRENGLQQVKNPSSLFLVRREGDLPPGVVVAPVYEGSRILLVEIQALTVPAKGGISRVFSDRIDGGRVSRIAAVLEKHVGIRFSDHDLYVNVAGGIRISEVGIEFPLALALYSARTDIPVPSESAVAGEVSLAGEIRPVPHLRRRIAAARETGFDRFLGPQVLREGEEPAGEWETVSTIREGIRKVFGKAAGQPPAGRQAPAE